MRVQQEPLEEHCYFVYHSYFCPDSFFFFNSGFLCSRALVTGEGAIHVLSMFFRVCEEAKLEQNEQG